MIRSADYTATLAHKQYGDYVREDREVYGDPWDDAPEAPKVVKGDATEKQVNFLRKLMIERDLPFTQESLDKLSKRDASALISTLLDGPKPVRKITPPVAPVSDDKVTEAGMYRNPKTGEIFKVQVAVHGSGHLYAKKLVIVTRGEDPKHTSDVYFEMARGAIFKLRASMKMTTEEAKAFGALYGCCCSCSKTLTLEDSIHNGYGRKCASNNGWAYEKAPKIIVRDPDENVKENDADENADY